MSQEKELKRLADAFERLAEIWDHPAKYLERITPEIQQAMQIYASQLPPPPTPQTGVVVPARVEVILAPEEKEKIINQVFGEIEGQIQEFKKFITEALAEMPESQLKKIAEHLKAGRKFKLRRRPPDCVSLDFGYGDEEFFLRM